MTEPVAYLVSQEPLSSVRWLSDVKPMGVDDKQITSLYTSEQLHQRVKMTQAEFDEFKHLISEYGFVLDALQAIYNGKYKNLYSKLFNGRTVESDNEQVKILTNLMSDFDKDNPEETIEIVPDMKWFVRSKKQLPSGKYLYLENSISKNFAPEYHQLDMAHVEQFDTKEQAELWKNPLTEVVLLPVEGDD